MLENFVGFHCGYIPLLPEDANYKFIAQLKIPSYKGGVGATPQNASRFLVYWVYTLVFRKANYKFIAQLEITSCKGGGGAQPHKTLRVFKDTGYS